MPPCILAFLLPEPSFLLFSTHSTLPIATLVTRLAAKHILPQHYSSIAWHKPPRAGSSPSTSQGFSFTQFLFTQHTASSRRKRRNLLMSRMLLIDTSYAALSVAALVGLFFSTAPRRSLDEFSRKTATWISRRHAMVI
ncbi:hypothetical protein DL89DRAFT_116625 [Linderina pennispora]|uniref:Uncharacterized protein n=1 Tax=Linderina pennispora TaxID=61395 RepID=A0A1Y1VVR2_9FUNG|nr:uncharacterized protein DL89DRAFT_116625 [Linderina pennispora]ORX65379.1 hypothetical protein DL89DRAFT_116625 [Linderina pennispora]